MDGSIISPSASRILKLNALAFSDSNSLYLTLVTPVISEPFSALVDSGSSDCFIDVLFVQQNSLPVIPINPVSLTLFDGTINSYITECVELPMHFSTGEVQLIKFYVTRLDDSCSVVLGYDWLSRYNPLIDWRMKLITFPDSKQEASTRTTSVLPELPEEPLITPEISVDDSQESSSAPEPGDELPTTVPTDSIDSPESPETPQKPNISLINATAFMRACQLEGCSQVYKLNLSLPGATVRSSSTSSSPPLDSDVDLSEVPEEYHSFADVFSKSRADTLADHRPYDLKIELEEGASPPIGPIYSLSTTELQTLREFIEESLNIGFIRPTKSPHGAPVLFIKKKDGSLRLCVDYRGLNKISKKDRYPIPLVADLLDAPKKARVFTKIDLRHAYHLVRIFPGDEWKTAFRTRYGSFEWLVMPFGLTNAPAAFQRFMNDIFGDLLDVCVLIYLDDILIYSNDMEEHRRHVTEVLRRLRENGLFAAPKKCFFHRDTVEFLGFMISPEGLTMDKAKIQTILDWPEPRKVKDIQSFLGFANFYRRFIHNYSELSIPLTRLTRKGTPWNFDHKCQLAFDSLKKAFTTAPVLTHWSPEDPIVVETDASDYALAAIISQHNQDGELHPIAFHSRTFSGAELNYDVHDKELLAIFEAFKKWRHYLEGTITPVDVVTDHKNLEYFITTKILTRRQARWSEFLSQFNLVIRFRPGKQGTKPDTLTRRWDVYPKEGGSDAATLNPQNLRPVFTREQLAASLRATFLTPVVLRGVVIMDVEKLHKDIGNALPDDSLAQEHLTAESMDPRWSTGDDGLLRQDGKIYVPSTGDLRTRVLQFKHDHILSGHFGQNKTLELVRREYSWPNLRTFVKDFCKSCTTCMRSKSQRHKPYGFLKQLPIPEFPWNSISMDFIEQLPESRGFTAILVIVDRLTKQSIFIPTYDTINSLQLAELFVLHVFSKHGVPGHVTSDRGSEFVSHFFKSLGKALDMKLHFTSGYHPEGDGQTERTNQTLEQYLRVYCNYQQDNWSELLPLAEFAYNNSPSATTGVSPFFANKGYHPNITVYPERDLASYRARSFVTDLDQLHAELRTQIAAAQARYQVSADSRRLPAPDIQIGSQVYVKAKYFRTTRPAKKLSEKYLGPFEVIAQPGTLSFTIKLPDHMRAVHPVFHVSMLEPHSPDTIPNRVQSPPPPVEVDGEIEYEIAEIVDSKLDKRRKVQLQYFVRWEGYRNHPEEFSWLSADELAHAQELVADFHKAYPDKPGPKY